MSTVPLTIAVTGANGFIGRALVQHLAQGGHQVLALSRSAARGDAVSGVRRAQVSDYADIAPLTALLRDCDVVVHLAALAHFVPRGESAQPDAATRLFAPNVRATKAVVQAAQAAGVQRFILLSSIGVNGSHTDGRAPFTEQDAAQPSEAYAQSKWLCEQALVVATQNSASMDYVIVRPPLVYGAHAPGRFGLLQRTVVQGKWLPLGGIANRRSFIGLDNLLDFIERCTGHPAARNQVFVVADSEAVSTPEFVRRVASAWHKPARLINAPVWLLRLLLTMAGRRAPFERLAASLEIDCTKGHRLLGWQPPYSLDLGLQRAAQVDPDSSAIAPFAPRPGHAIKRTFDFALACAALCLLTLPLLVLAALVKLSSPGPVLYWSARVGQGNRLFQMPKFRSMRIDTPVVATHLLTNPQQWLTPMGGFLRRSSLDELPQLLNILRGDMSFVGPRPALFNQHDLIELRTEKGVHALVPGLTGWAQINGRDDLPVTAKVALDAYYLGHQSPAFDLKILALTAVKVVRGDGVAH